jgi:uncharacterized protein (TIGR02145 family)
VVNWGPANPAASLFVIETDGKFPATLCSSPSLIYAVNITPRPTPTITLPVPSGICQGQTGIYSTESGMHNYVWTIPAGGQITQGGDGFDNVHIKWNATPGMKTILVNYTNSYNCDGLPPGGSATLQVNPLPDVNISGTGTSPVCQEFPQTYPYTTQVVDPSASYSWSIPLGSGTISPVISSNPIQVKWLSSGLAQLKVIATSSFGCVDAQTIPVTVMAKPLVSLSSSCFDQTTILNAKPIKLKGGLPNGTGGLYYIDLPLVNPVTHFTPSSIGLHNIYFSFTNDDGCIATSNPGTITVMDPSAFFTGCNSTITDRRETPPKTYRTIQIGTQCWMQDNLRYGTPEASVNRQTDNCVFQRYDLSSVYGGFYQWDELMQYDPADQAQGFCPPGWHIPNESEWLVLSGYISSGIGVGTAASFLKDNVNGRFFPDPAGIFYLNYMDAFTTGSPLATFFWTSTFDAATRRAVARGINSVTPSVSRYESSVINAFPVRCVWDH